jgi:hypothetical protein
LERTIQILKRKEKKRMVKVEIEKSFDGAVGIEAFYTGKRRENLDDVVAECRYFAPGMKVGRGGNHVWIADAQNVRHAIIKQEG